MILPYDSTNVFARIIRGEVKCEKILDNDQALAFYDTAPQAPLHVLIIPKGFYQDSAQFYHYASDQEILGFSRLLAQIIEHLKIQEQGFRLVTNCGKNASQEIPHFHLHLLAGEFLGPMRAKS